ncbi:DUF3817 domain-containing protein [Epidermidibacterium keratini]|uniref:DUF3817 domain-containing protein n=1 Tax=Epidermidibacterium keratini TaxID=1891644 RepID=UPI001CEF968B|nr:DUF3817 domain-containing protein [Epidermidibacterium keratini]
MTEQPAARTRPRKSFIDRTPTASLLRNYRISAWVVGVPLAALILVAMPMKYFGGIPEPTTIIGIAHGWLYMVYFVCTVLLSLKRHWSIGRTALVVICGTIPLVSFYAEHVVHKNVTAQTPGW